ncbi:iron ABC transporter permease [SAR202 cluster bacterium AD-493-K16_JPT_193m]|nr:iron ABC transporter permease [SAR202 cluster bacterium AD-493-K16_JPT_193m]
MTARRILILGPILYLSAFFFYPLVAILGRSINTGDGLDISPFMSILGDSYYLGRVWFTIWQATVSTVVTLLLGLPIAYIFARHEFRGKTLLRAASTVPFIMPTIVVAMGFISLFGPQGALNSLLMNLFGFEHPPIRISNTLTIIFMAHAFYNYAIVVRVVSAFWANLNPRLEETAAVLGASKLNTFMTVTLPLLLPSIISSAILAFAFSFTSFGVVLVLGGPQFATMEVATYELTAKLFRLELAGALAIIQLFFTYVFMLLYARTQDNIAVRSDLVPREFTKINKRTVRQTLSLILIILTLVAILSPLLILIERALTSGDGYSINHFLSLFANDNGSYFYLTPIAIIANSVRFAAMTTVIALLVGTSAAYFLAKSSNRSSWFQDAFYMMPLGVSAVVMGLGYLLAFNRPPVDLRGSWLILIIAHSLIAYPFVIRSVLPALRAVPTQLQESAAVLGASPTKTFIHIHLPILTPGLIVGAPFAFAVSMGEFGASLLLVRPEFTTMPVAIFRLLGQPGSSNFGQALAMSSLLMMIVAAGFIAIERLRYRNSGGF